MTCNVTYADIESEDPKGTQTGPLDLFNNKNGPNLINDEIRDQSDQIYIDLKTRDVNGNVKKPIGTGIDDIGSTSNLYEND